MRFRVTVMSAEPVACGPPRSHLYYAAQLIQLLVLLAVVSTTHYFSSTWGAWLVSPFGALQMLTPRYSATRQQCQQEEGLR